MGSFAQTYTEQEGRNAWQQLKRQTISEKSFREVCDLMQDIGKTNLKLSYEIMAEYEPRIEATGNRHWVHILLMNWAKAKESTGYPEEAEKLYYEVWKNTNPKEQYYRESLVAVVLMYGEWGKMDSLNKYVNIGEKLCQEAGDKESLSFLYGFKATTSNDTGTMRDYFERAINLATNLPDKNALFTARYNHAYKYLQNNLQEQVIEFEKLLELAKDSTLNHYPRKLYERTAFTFRNAGPSVYYNLMQINFLLTDYDNAWKFAELFYDATIKPNPSHINAPYFNAEMAIAAAWKNDFSRAKEYLDLSRTQFNLAEDKIPYLSYFIAAGMLAEHAEQNSIALSYYAQALKKGNTQSQHMVPPEIYYAHMLIRANQLKEAEQVLGKLQQMTDAQKYSAIGLNYYKYYAELLKAKNDHTGYSQTLETYYAIKDSLTNITRYRAIKEVEAKVRIRDKEQQIVRLNDENTARTEQLRKERIFYAILIGFAGLIIVLLALYLRNRQISHRQQAALQQIAMEQREKQHRIEVMQGAMNAEENERRKIAGQLHDDVNAMLALASLNVSSTLEKGRQDEQSEKKLQKTHDILVSISGTIRDLSHKLTPVVIEKYGFKKAIEELGDTANLSEKIKLETIIVGFDKTEKYSTTFLNDLYRIIQELLHNILKHARATHALLEMVEHEKHISIMVEDDGVGIEENGTENGQGLKTIRSRIAYLKGEMEIARKKDSGTLVVIEIEV
jgi:signal transduction histidine kinase